MAEDVVGLLDHLGIERAHVVGASMGSMIAQTLAATHPDRVSSLVSIMGNTGARTVRAADPARLEGAPRRPAERTATATSSTR